MTKAAHISGHFLVYVTEYRTEPLSRPRSLAVAFFAMPGATGQELAHGLADYFLGVPQTEELLVIAPADLSPEVEAIALSDALSRAAKFSAFSEVHHGSILADGTWSIASKTSLRDVMSSVRTELVQSGLRRIFESGGALLTSRGGYHFVKPSDKHSENFLRAGNALTRSVAVYFVAQACLAWISEFQFSKIVVDSGSISSVGYALQSLQSRLQGKSLAYVVDSFGGYDGMRSYYTAEPLDTLVLVSASTSGGLTQEVESALAVPSVRQLVLFYVGDKPSGFNVLCDLTETSGTPSDSSYVMPWRSWSQSECQLCRNGQPAIRLEGDAFLPASGTLTDRLITKRHAPVGLSSFVERFRGLDAFRVRASDLAAEPVTRSTLVRYAHLLDGTNDNHAGIRSAIVSRLERFIPLTTSQIIVLDDPESRAIADLAQELIEARTGRRLPQFGEGDLTSTRPLTFEPGFVLVIAGTVVGGRQLLSVSRALRRLHDGGEIAYFIGLGRPSTKARWSRLLSNLQFGPTGARHFPVDVVWYLESDPDRGSHDAWSNERALLTNLHTFILALPQDHPKRAEFYRLVEHRQEGLARIGSGPGRQLLFVPPWYGVAAETKSLQLNPNFAFWDFEYSSSGDVTEDEVYFTISSVLHAARHTADGAYSLMDEGGSRYVLSPENFHRFNDGIIQACLLRGAMNMELDFRADSNLSAAVRDTILSSITNFEADEGQGAVEFLISLCGGLVQQKGGFLRIKDRHLLEIVEATRDMTFPSSPYLEMFVLYLANRTDRLIAAA